MSSIDDELSQYQNNLSESPKVASTPQWKRRNTQRAVIKLNTNNTNNNELSQNQFNFGEKMEESSIFKKRQTNAQQTETNTKNNDQVFLQNQNNFKRSIEISSTPQLNQKNFRQAAINPNNDDNFAQTQNNFERNIDISSIPQKVHKNSQQNAIDSQSENSSNTTDKKLSQLQKEDELAVNLSEQLEKDQLIDEDLSSINPIIQKYFNLKNRRLEERRIIIEQLFQHVNNSKQIFVKILLCLLKKISNLDNLIIIINEVIKQMNDIKQVAIYDDFLSLIDEIISKFSVIQQIADIDDLLSILDGIIYQISIIQQFERPNVILLLLDEVFKQISNLENSKNEVSIIKQEELNNKLIVLLTNLCCILSYTKLTDEWKDTKIQKKIHEIKQSFYDLITTNQKMDEPILNGLALSIFKILLFEYSLGLQLDLDFDYIFSQLFLAKNCWEPITYPSSYIFLKVIQSLLDENIPNQNSLLYDSQVSDIIEIFNLYLEKNQDLNQTNLNINQSSIDINDKKSLKQQKKITFNYRESIQEMILNTIKECISKFHKYYNNIQNFEMQVNELLFLFEKSDRFIDIIYNCFYLFAENYYDNLYIIIQKIFSLSIRHICDENTFKYPLEFWEIIAKTEKKIGIKRSKHYTLGLIKALFVEKHILPLTTLYYSDDNEADDPNDPNEKEIYYIAQNCLKTISKTEPETMFDLLSKYFKSDCKDTKNCISSLVLYRCILSSSEDDERIDFLTTGYTNVIIKYAKGTNVKLKCFAFDLIRRILKKYPIIIINEQNRKYENMEFTWESPSVVSFKAFPKLFNTTTIKCTLKFSLEKITESAVVTKRLDSMGLTCCFDSNSSLYPGKTGISVQVEDDKRIKDLVFTILSNSGSDPLVLDQCYLIMSLILKHHSKLVSNLIIEKFDELYGLIWLSFKSKSATHNYAIEYAVDLFKYAVDLNEEEKKEKKNYENFDKKICDLFNEFIESDYCNKNYSDEQKLYFRLLPIIVKKLQLDQSYNLNFKIIEKILKILGPYDDNKNNNDDTNNDVDDNGDIDDDINIAENDEQDNGSIMYQEILEAIIEIIPLAKSIPYKKFGNDLFNILIYYHEQNDWQTMKLTSDAISILFENYPNELQKNLPKINDVIHKNLTSETLIQKSYSPVFSLISSIVKIAGINYKDNCNQLSDDIKDFINNTFKNFTQSLIVDKNNADDDLLDLCYMILDAYFSLINVFQINEEFIKKVEKQILSFIKKLENVILAYDDFVEISIKIIFVIICTLGSSSFIDLSKPSILKIIEKGSEFEEDESVQSVSIKIKNILTNHC